ASEELLFESSATTTLSERPVASTHPLQPSSAAMPITTPSHFTSSTPPTSSSWPCDSTPPPLASKSRRNMQLFKQFSQPRMSTGTAAQAQGVADSSKTAPSSPLTPTEGRGSFFKVQEVEARIEDTKRRLSEVMSDPLHLFSKMMGDEPAAASGGGPAPRSRSPSLTLGRCSMSALAARQEDEDFFAHHQHGALVYGYLVCPVPPRRRRKRTDRWNVTQLDIQEPGIFKGWMNEIHSYDPETYHATYTHSVYVRLEGSVLRLSKPNRNIARRATHNEPKPDVTYVSQKIYDLTDSKIHLVPQSLARKRVWNKKYPICLELAKQEDFMSKAQGERPEAGDERADPAAEDKGDAGERADGEETPRRPPVSGGGGGGGGTGGGGLTIYLFGRTGRDKEEWFRRFLLASGLRWEGRGGGGFGSGAWKSGESQHDDMINTFPRGPGDSAEPEAWVNALLGRVFWDFLGEKYWANLVSKKIQMKLSKIRLPYFMNELTLTELDMGYAIPKLLQASRPSVDHQGLWFDLEISYSGSFLMTLETKMNLARLGKEGEGLGEPGKDGPRTYCLADSDEESSSAGSSDEEDTAELLADKAAVLPGGEGYSGGHRPSKIMRFVDKIAKSKYFQKATETEFIRKKIEEMSNTPLLLTVEVQECRGTLAVNIPPPPTDRIWYGFRNPPHLELKARPKLGEREVTFANVTDWIEKKLDQEFQ
ncbi:hypothetical protein NHX12_031574, partial [Muraenolepis orangiensis]